MRQAAKLREAARLVGQALYVGREPLRADNGATVPTFLLIVYQMVTRKRLARSLKARSPPSRMSHTCCRMSGFSRLPLSYVMSGNWPGL